MQGDRGILGGAVRSRTTTATVSSAPLSDDGFLDAEDRVTLGALRVAEDVGQFAGDVRLAVCECARVEPLCQPFQRRRVLRSQRDLPPEAARCVMRPTAR